MMKSLSLLLLVSTFFFANCSCNNSDTGDGPRDEEKNEESKFSLALADGVKREDLLTSRPIPLILKDRNFSKHGTTAYKCSNHKMEKGTLHFMDPNGKPGKRLESSDTIELKGGLFPLVFVPNGKLGKDTISLNLTPSNKGDSFDVSLELDLKEEKPQFSLTLTDEVKGEDLLANRPIPMVLKDENFSKHDITTYKYPKQKAEKGNFHFMDVDGKPGRRVESSDTIEIKDGVFPLVFVPNGKSGKDTISLNLTSSNKGNSFDVSLELDLKSIISLETPEEVKTSKLATAYLKINADPEEEFTLKSVRIDYYPLEMTYDNGEVEGVWAEVNSVRIGDKFKGGEHELSLKLYGDNDKVGDEAYQGDKSNIKDMQPVKKWIYSIQQEVSEYWFRPVDLDMVLVDKNGNEHSAKASFKVEDISFDFDLEISFHPTAPEVFGMKMGDVSGVDSELAVKIKKDGMGNSGSGGKKFKILSIRANDGSFVSLVEQNFNGWVQDGFKDLEERTFEANPAHFYVNFKDMPINRLSKSTILTIKLEGPGGVVKSADVEVTWQERQFILFKRIKQIHERAIYLTGELADCVKYNGKGRGYIDAEKWGKAAVAFLEEVKFMASQVGDPKLLSTCLSPETIQEMESALKWIQHLKKRLEMLNKTFSFNFQSPI